MDDSTRPPRVPACADVDSLTTRYVDEEISDDDRRAVASHLAACPPCAQRVKMEQAARSWLRSAARAFTPDAAPPQLRARVAESIAPARPQVSYGRRLAALAAAAVAILAVGGALIAAITSRSTTVLAAELTLDHIKCARLGAPMAHGEDPAELCRDFRARFGWDLALPSDPGVEGLQLVGGRRCLSGEGQVAHIAYRLNGRAISLFMQPNSVREAEELSVLGYSHIVWSRDGSTYLLTGDVERPDLERVARALRREDGYNRP